jgi:hypothetical protein
MSKNSFSLEDIDRELEAEYAPVEFTVQGDVYTLLPLLRVDKDRRKKAQDALKAFESKEDGTVVLDASVAEGDEDELEKLTQALKVVLSNVTKGPEYVGQMMVDKLGNDFLRHMKLMQKWSEATQPGEASSSSN